MHLLYLDDAGSPADNSQKYYVLGGFSVFERQPHWVSQRLDGIAARFAPGRPGVELHGNPMVKGSGTWRKVPKMERVQAYKDALEVLGAHSGRAFVAVINKQAASPRDPVEVAFEQVASRFDQLLLRLHRKGDTQRGMIICDKTTRETSLQTLAIEFKHEGHSFGQLTNQADVPVFVDSRATRLIQLADLVAHAAFRKYERADSQFFDLVEPRLDSDGGIVHGLYVLP